MAPVPAVAGDLAPAPAGTASVPAAPAVPHVRLPADPALGREVLGTPSAQDLARHLVPIGGLLEGLVDGVVEDEPVDALLLAPVAAHAGAEAAPAVVPLRRVPPSDLRQLLRDAR
ncbi:hypothetical protein F1544_22725 [Kineosporiaceae bacterium B12]|nr:hypothetical protein [Kineococcus rubinsiae]